MVLFYQILCRKNVVEKNVFCPKSQICDPLRFQSNSHAGKHETKRRAISDAFKPQGGKRVLGKPEGEHRKYNQAESCSWRHFQTRKSAGSHILKI